MKLAFTGISGAGKDFLVDHLVKNYGYHRVSFSDQLKKLAVKVYPWMEKDYPPIKKEEPLNITIPETGELITQTPRQIWLSLNSLRNVENGLFIRMLQEELNLLKVDNVVISDIRPQIEWDWCNESGFTTIYVKPNKLIYEPNDFDKNIAEYEASSDFVFENDFSGISKFDEFIKGVLSNAK